MANSDITAERLRELLDYDHETGVFRWRFRRAGLRFGKPAGNLHRFGYVVLQVDGVRYKAHRLAWLHVVGRWPVADVDHINGCRADNRFVNLREASRSQNIQNQRRAGSRSKSGLLGATPNKNAWQSQIVVNGKQVYLGTFKTPEQAHQTYLDAKRKLHPGCTI